MRRDCLGRGIHSKRRRSFPLRIFLKKNACEIFHDEAMSRRFRLLGRLFDRRTWFLSSSFLAQMRLFRIILMSVLLAGVALHGHAAESVPRAEVGSAAEPGHTGPPVSPEAP